MTREEADAIYRAYRKEEDDCYNEYDRLCEKAKRRLERRLRETKEKHKTAVDAMAKFYAEGS